MYWSITLYIPVPSTHVYPALAECNSSSSMQIYACKKKMSFFLVKYELVCDLNLMAYSRKVQNHKPAYKYPPIVHFEDIYTYGFIPFICTNWLHLVMNKDVVHLKWMDVYWQWEGVRCEKFCRVHVWCFCICFNVHARHVYHASAVCKLSTWFSGMLYGMNVHCSSNGHGHVSFVCACVFVLLLSFCCLLYLKDTVDFEMGQGGRIPENAHDVFGVQRRNSCKELTR